LDNNKINSNSNFKSSSKNKSSSLLKSTSSYGMNLNLNHRHSSHSNIHHYSSHPHDISNSLMFSSSPSVSQNALDLATYRPTLFQNMEMNMNMTMDPPVFSVSSYNMAVGMTNITRSPQTVLPPSHLSDFRMISPPLTPPPFSSSYNGSNSLGLSSNVSFPTNMPFIFGRRNGIKGNGDVKGNNNLQSPSLPNFNNYDLSGMNYIPNVPSLPFKSMNNFNIVNNTTPNPNLSHLNLPLSQVLSPYHIQVQQLYVSNELIGCVIGKQGECIKRIRNISGSQIKIAEPNPNNTDRLITITGNVETNHVAMCMILGRLENERNKLMKQQKQQLSPSPSPSSSPSIVQSLHHH